MTTIVRAGLLSLMLVATASQATDTQVFAFDVTLDGDRIGSHEFVVEPTVGGQRVVSNAAFDVRILFFNAFRYRHQNVEVWEGDCLRQLESRTEVNRKRLAVNGGQADSGFLVNSGEGDESVGDCVMTFAYWNPAFLEQPRLLNPQDGRYLNVDIERLPEQTISVRGEPVRATVYQVTAENMRVKLWYSEREEWLALESLARGGRVIRYELS